MAVFLYGGELIFEKKSTYFWERPLVEITHIFSLSCVSFVYCYPLTTCLWNFLKDGSTLEKKLFRLWNIFKIWAKPSSWVEFNDPRNSSKIHKEFLILCVGRWQVNFASLKRPFFQRIRIFMHAKKSGIKNHASTWLVFSPYFVTPCSEFVLVICY